MSERYFRVSTEGFVAELVLNRPRKLNVVDFGFFEELGEHLKRLEMDESVRVVLIWAEGKLFTAGLDLNHAQKEIFGSAKSEGDRAQFSRVIYHWLNQVQSNISFMQTMNKPVIMAIHNGTATNSGTHPCQQCNNLSIQPALELVSILQLLLTFGFAPTTPHSPSRKQSLPSLLIWGRCKELKVFPIEAWLEKWFSLESPLTPLLPCEQVWSIAPSKLRFVSIPCSLFCSFDISLSG
eukprot:TRINITY_DN2892_c0_g1_i3.p1 TRINITY_DN2892_c0_g1~~TRINITY_DN2892_c0_g1_i3.p1  ORF type:complete len:237 (+),score=9.30 TRINITY_DN2892_c0_g1_i3:29-739(+)